MNIIHAFINLFKSRPKEFTIEFYPVEGDYYAKYGNKYLCKKGNVIELEQISHLVFATSFKTEKEAKNLIEQYKHNLTLPKVIETVYF